MSCVLLVNISMTRLLAVCTEWMGEPWGCEGQAVQWMTVDELTALPMPPIDKGFLMPIRSAIELLTGDDDVTS